MIDLRDLLRRFRPVAAPGPATRVGAPADRVPSAAAELAPVFEALELIQAEVSTIRSAADLRVQAVRDEAAEELRLMLAETRERAAAQRASAASERLRDADQEHANLMAAAEAECARIHLQSAERMPALVERVVGRVRAASTRDPSEGSP